jgi:hypothetical protein
MKVSKHHNEREHITRGSDDININCQPNIQSAAEVGIIGSGITNNAEVQRARCMPPTS